MPSLSWGKIRICRVLGDVSLSGRKFSAKWLSFKDRKALGSQSKEYKELSPVLNLSVLDVLVTSRAVTQEMGVQITCGAYCNIVDLLFLLVDLFMLSFLLFNFYVAVCSGLGNRKS